MDPGFVLSTVRALADGEEPFFAALERGSRLDVAAYAGALERQRLMRWVEPAVLSPEGRRRLPAALVAAVESGSDARRRRHAEVVAETLEVDDALARAGLACRHLKGVSFGQRFYGDPRRRHQRDVDVLVRGTSRDAALAALEAIGYAREPGVITEGVVRWGLGRGYAAVDLHWNLRRRARRRVDAEELFADPVGFEIGGRTLETVSDDATLVFLLLSLCGDLRRGACGIRHLLDLHLVLRGLAPALDAEAFFERRARQRLLMPCVNVLAVFFALWRAAPEFPELAESLLRRRQLVRIRGADEALALLTPNGNGGAGRRWFRRAYPYNVFDGWARRLTIDLGFTLSRWLPSRRFRLADAEAGELRAS
ncbi:MAG TPA: nucleotidyltransferase family protein [Myxococcota bacterium]|nr:nucleotidyltransferase family protein [Myxococcota bacterium]